MIQDEVLGNLMPSDLLDNALEGGIGYCNRVVNVQLMDRCKKFTSAISIARQLVQDLARFDDLARTHATTNFLDLYNDTWREVDEIDESGELFSDPVLSEEAFRNKIKLESISINADDANEHWSCDFVYDDGDLFAGHLIVVSPRDGLEFNDCYSDLVG